MATTKDFIEYVCENMRDAGEITYKKMFGEYGFYLDGLFIGAVCDNQLFFKVTETGRAVLKEELMAPMYKGAKPSFLVEQIDDHSYISAIARATYDGLKEAKKK